MSPSANPGHGVGDRLDGPVQRVPQPGDRTRQVLGVAEAERVQRRHLRAETDEEFRRILQDSPERGLAEYGLSAADVERLNGDPGVVGVTVSRVCADTTCWVSTCPGTCYVTWAPEVVFQKQARADDASQDG